MRSNKGSSHQATFLMAGWIRASLAIKKAHECSPIDYSLKFLPEGRRL